MVLASGPPHLGAQYHDRGGRLPREHHLHSCVPREHDLHPCVPREYDLHPCVHCDFFLRFLFRFRGQRPRAPPLKNRKCDLLPL